MTRWVPSGPCPHAACTHRRGLCSAGETWPHPPQAAPRLLPICRSEDSDSSKQGLTRAPACPSTPGAPPAPGLEPPPPNGAALKTENRMPRETPGPPCRPHRHQRAGCGMLTNRLRQMQPLSWRAHLERETTAAGEARPKKASETEREPQTGSLQRWFPRQAARHPRSTLSPWSLVPLPGK